MKTIRLYFPFTLLFCFSFVMFGCKTNGPSKAEVAMLPDTEMLNLWPGDPPGEAAVKNKRYVTTERNGRLKFVHVPTLEVRHAKGQNRTGAAVVICPGGGYGALAHGHEGDAVATWLGEHGITAIILRYRMYPYRHPVPMWDVQRALLTVRANAEQWGLDPGRIGVLGFSAGGHLASTAAVQHAQADEDSSDPIERVSSRPDFAVLIYPVISMRQGVTHGGSRKTLLGPEPEKKLIAGLSSDEQVNAHTPPTFLVHSKDDVAVPIKNSEMFLAALKKHGVPGELLVFETGGHGYGLGRQGGHETAAWPDRCIAWLKESDVIR